MSEICIIIPCYNEANRLPINEFSEFIEQNKNIHFCFVNDGSKDSTLEVLLNLQSKFSEHILVENLVINQGKAEAVRRGILRILENENYKKIGYFDADLATPLTEISLLNNSLNKDINFTFAFGARVKLLGRKIERKISRHYFGRIFATCASLILKLAVYDTQCGAKLFNRTIAIEISKEPFLSRWLFDIEIFARIIKKYGRVDAEKQFIEVPLEQWLEKDDSKLSFAYLLKVPFELLKIKFHYKIK